MLCAASHPVACSHTAVGLGTSQQGAFGHPLFTQQRSFADGDGKSDALEKASTVEDVWRTVEAAGDSMDDKAVLAAFKQVGRVACVCSV